MALNPNLQKFTTASPVIASYDWVDLADGTGYVILDGYASTDTVGTNYYLRKGAITSDPGGIATANVTITVSKTFDTTTFNIPRHVKGNMSLTFSIATTGAGGSSTAHVTAGAYHYDGTTETQMGSTQTSVTISSSSAATNVLTIEDLDKQFGAGDLLRIKIDLVVTSGGGNTRTQFGHDPLNRNYIDLSAATNPTYFKVEVPFKLDL